MAVVVVLRVLTGCLALNSVVFSLRLLAVPGLDAAYMPGDTLSPPGDAAQPLCGQTCHPGGNAHSSHAGSHSIGVFGRPAHHSDLTAE